MSVRIPLHLRGLRYESGKMRPWVAEIVGRDPRFGFRRRFLRPAKDHAGDTKGRAPPDLWYFLRDGRLYEVQAHVKAAKLRRYFAATVGGKVLEIGQEDMVARLDARGDVTKRPLGIDVYTAARQRIAWTFDTFSRVCVSFSGGKDSTVMLHLAMDEARRRRRKVGVLFVDLEAQYRLTIDHVAEMYREYAEWVEPYWVALPLSLRNAVSVFEPQWTCWDAGKREAWVREPHEASITDPKAFPFFESGMEFEEFVAEFGQWYSRGEMTAQLVGIRSDESLNRFRTLASGSKTRLDRRCWTTWLGGSAFNVYPIYDWKTEDLWTYTAREGKIYNRLYDRMHAAGLTVHQMRICQPYGDDQRKGLWLYHVVEPETWGRVVARVAGANSGALFSRDTGNVQGRIRIAKPDGHTWQTFAGLLLETMPPPLRAHFQGKIDLFFRYWSNHGYGVGSIPDESDPKEEAAKKAPSWRRVVRTILKNDYWCKTIGFSQTQSGAYDRYKAESRRKIGKCSG